MNDVMHQEIFMQSKHPSSDGLRRLADFLDKCAQTGIEVGSPTEVMFVKLGQNELATAAGLARALGSFKKEFGDTTFSICRNFGDLDVKFIFWRNSICERVVIGTEHVPEKVIPAHTVEKVEWRCPGPLMQAAVPQQAEPEPIEQPPQSVEEIF